MKPFISRVTERIAPGYREVIKHPMDLTTVCSKLESPGDYSSAEDAKADIALVFLCLLCNRPLCRVCKRAATFEQALVRYESA